MTPCILFNSNSSLSPHTLVFQLSGQSCRAEPSMDMADTRLPYPFYHRHHPPLHLQLTPTLQTPETTAERWTSHSLTSMGNYASCTLATASKGAKVVLPTGNVRQLADGTNVAELMLEIPNHFVVNARSMHVGQRFAPLSADEELNKGNVYVLFPMRKVSSIVTAADMGVLLMMARSTVKQASGGKARILPEARERLEEDVVGAEVKVRLSVSRSKKPALATIVEEPISSRRRDVTKYFLA